MKIEPERLLQHSLSNSLGSTNSVITYKFDERNRVTILYAREDFTKPITDEEYADSAEGWDPALLAVKKQQRNKNEKTFCKQNN